jgi:hypothetical protein
MKIYIQVFLFLFFYSYSNSQNLSGDYIRAFKDIAINEMKIYNIPASITLSQGILESAHGTSELASENNNHFGIKCHSNWDGETVYLDDDKKNECFRKYSSAKESFRDHSLFLTENSRYSSLFSFKSYKKWARGLKKAGYATNPNYDKLLINIVKKHSLFKYDNNSQKKFYLSNNYGFPFAYGLGLNLFLDNFYTCLKLESSYITNKSSFAFSYNFFQNIYVGSNLSLISNKGDFTESLSFEISSKINYRSSSRYEMIVITIGVDPFVKRNNKTKIEKLLYQYCTLSFLF